MNTRLLSSLRRAEVRGLPWGKPGPMPAALPESRPVAADTQLTSAYGREDSPDFPCLECRTELRLPYGLGLQETSPGRTQGFPHGQGIALARTDSGLRNPGAWAAWWHAGVQTLFRLAAASRCRERA